MIAFSSSHKLPIVFVTHDRLAAERNGKQWRRLPSASSLELPRISVEVNDVVAIYRVAQEAIPRAREGHGPALNESLGLQEKRPAKPVKKRLPEGMGSWRTQA